MSLYAAAARVVCECPDALESVTRRLDFIGLRLVPPEAIAAEECMRRWALFARVARSPKARLRIEAAKALCRDLDALGQRFDLPPLLDWDDLPVGIDDPDAIDPDPAGSPDGGRVTLQEVRQALLPAMTATAAGRQKAVVPLLAGLLSELSQQGRHELFQQVLAEGVITRADVSLLVRWLVKGGSVGAQDAVLIEVLDRVGRWIVR